jgi:D-alanyl-lipoteichoic acid acyltransferase DltB (MBOAT superfamily)
MLFNSVEFAVFLAIVLAIYYQLGHRQQNWLLLVASYMFYGMWDWRFLSLLFVSTFVDYICGLWVAEAHRRDRPRQARLAMSCSLLANLGILGFFKYFNFFIDSAAALLDRYGLPSSDWTLNIILPVGISFYTFQTLSYTIDIYRRELQPTSSLLDFAVFVAFFPQLVAGPIERAANFLPQVARPRRVTRDDWTGGAYLIFVGLIRKVVVADTAGALADRYFADPAAYSSLQLAMALFLYALQIYGDFSGYSNIARGTAMLLGFRLMRNFQHPYFAQSFSEFWRRWHISLSTWLRDYIYIPLGGNRHGAVRTHVNLMSTMLLGGLWHGASWNFVIWGGLHGLFLVVERILRLERLATIPHQTAWMARVVSLARMALLFGCVAFTWLFFRLSDMDVIAEFIHQLSQLTLVGKRSVLAVLVLAAITLLIDIPQHLSDDEFVFLRWPVVYRGAWCGAGSLLLLVSGNVGHEPFIYFQF